MKTVVNLNLRDAGLSTVGCDLTSLSPSKVLCLSKGFGNTQGLSYNVYETIL